MRGSSLTVVAILFFGAVFVAMLGCLNPFVPKKYQKVVKNIYKAHGHGEGREIPILVRYDNIFYLVISVLVITAATVVHLLIRYSSVKDFFDRAALNVIVSVGVWVVLASIMEVFYVMAAFLAETMVIQSLENYYRKFGFKAVDVRVAEISNN